MAVTINGSAGVTTNSGAVYDSLQRGTAVTASGTSVDFTSIPSWVRRITVMFSGVSTSGTSPFLIQIGNGAIISTGYTSSTVGATSGNVLTGSSQTAGFGLTNANIAANTYFGQTVILNVTGNTWESQTNIVSAVNTFSTYLSGGALALSGTLDRVRITTVNGTDTFDAGTINIIYE